MSFATLAQILPHHVRERPERVALRAGERSWTYRALRDEAFRVSQALLAEGLAGQDRVAVLDRNVPEILSLLFGAAAIDVVTLAMSWRLAPPEMEYILNDAQARVLLIGEEFLPHLPQMRLETVKRIVVVPTPGSDLAAGRRGASEDSRTGAGAEATGSDAAADAPPGPSYAEWIADRPATDPEIVCQPDATCFQLYTSGTTGRPKGVELMHSNLLAAMEAGAKAWSIDADSVSLIAMPLFHIAGGGWSVAGLCHGAENVLLRDLDPDELLRLIERHRVTNALFVPAVLQILGRHPKIREVDLGSFRSVVYGASPISEEVLVRAMEVFGCGFVQVYGLTETTGAITDLQPEDHDPGGLRAHLLRSAGRPWSDVRIRIVDAETLEDLPEGEVGEIWCHSRQNMKGYWRNPEATAEVYPEGRDENGIGWFRTGDAGYLRDGYLFIHDRVKDMIVSGAENVYPAEVENVLMAHPSVADVAVIGVPSEKWGETVKAIVVDAAEGGASDESLIAWCRERLAHYKCPTSIDRIAALPRNPSGKILKTELREPYWRGRDRRVN